MTKTLWTLVLITVLGAIVRLYDLNRLPNSLNRDEAALAYNAVLLKEVGQDEWGRSWPLVFESFGDYKLPGYVWLTVVSLTAFGYQDWAVRLPAAVAGIILIPITYWLGRRWGLAQRYALIWAGLTASLPVFIFYSRMAWEATVGLVLTVVILGFLLPVPAEATATKASAKSTPNQALFDVAAVIMALLAVFTYNTPFLLLPFLILVLPLWRGIKSWQRWWLPVVGLTVVWLIAARILLPLSAQKSGITIFSDETTWQNSITYRQQFSGVTQKLLGSKYVYWASLIVKNIVASFSPQFLVTQGGRHPWHQIPGFAHLTWPVYGLSVIGLLGLWVKHFRRPLTWLTTYLLLVSLAPAVITVDAPHATRSLLFMVMLTWLAVHGWREVSELLSRTSQFKLTPALISILLCLWCGWETNHYLSAYFGEYRSQSQAILRAGFAQVLADMEQSPHQQVAIVDEGGYQYIIAAWYLQLSPADFFHTVIKQQPDRIGLKYGQQVGKYHFIAQPTDRSAAETALVLWSDSKAKWNTLYFE